MNLQPLQLDPKLAQKVVINEQKQLFVVEGSVYYSVDTSELVVLTHLAAAEPKQLVPLNEFNSNYKVFEGNAEEIVNYIKQAPRLNEIVFHEGFVQGLYCKHSDGGYYQFQEFAVHKDDSLPLVLYTHVWPFERGNWARPLGEFVAKFIPITPEDLEKARSEPQEDVQQRITASRNARRGIK